ncbi:MarP family serine protease [Corynebacterium sp.]|uniref:MarP family serine protease n=1 Tax=Corynebacterium sp. TaxID=1720 RepID=UPI003736EDFC
MIAALIVDVIIVVIVIVALMAGWRQGAFASVISAIGIIAGLVIGLAVAPFIVELADASVWRLLLLIAVILLFVGLGNLVGATIGAAWRDRMRKVSSLRLDSFIGAVLQSLAAILVIWLISIPVAANVPGTAGQAIRNSKVLSIVDEAAPAWASRLPAQLSALLDESGLPPLVSPFDAGARQHVDAPASSAVDPSMVERSRESIVHVRGEAESCRRRLMGSGWVVADNYVITNAHVVAGTTEVVLETVLGMKQANVVYYNPDVDIAVLRSPELGLKSLPVSDELVETGQDTVVMGFPQSGPFEAAPARVRDRITIAGPDIYATGRVEREAYTVRGTIRQGNSGGPMTTTDGEVIGVVFGASVDSSDTGYALTIREVKQQVGNIQELTTPVDTQECVSR